MTRFSKCKVVQAHEPVSFWRENLIAVVTLPRVYFSENVVVTETSHQMLAMGQKFYHFAMGRGLNLFH